MSNKKRNEAPLFERMREHYDKLPASFHVPGHKSGRGADPAAASFFEPLMALDYTEISGLDDLHQPEGVIREAQELAADCFGADETFFLVGGSTVGNLAMIMSLCGTGDILLVQRNVHKSVLHGLMLAGAHAVFISPALDGDSGIPASVRWCDVEDALNRYPEAKGLLLTNPNYYGMGVNLRPYAELAHSRGIPLLVDEAHGAHYGFHPELPESALASGADAVVQSTHKMLSAMTMGAMLHLQGDRMDRGRIRTLLAMLQSSSPSYPILASLDLARKQMHTCGRELINQGLDAVKLLCSGIHSVHGLKVLEPPVAPEAYDSLDPFKITLYDSTGTLTGTDLQELLEEAGCYVEFASGAYVLLLLTIFTSLEDAQRALDVCRSISTRYLIERQELRDTSPNSMYKPLLYSVSKPVPMGSPLFTNNQEQNVVLASLDDSTGQRSAEMVIPYPPGIPLLYPGEIITEETADKLKKLVASGARFHGSVEVMRGYLKVRQESPE
ncbi:aminotransferase class I/II-fold pyridoxal phosphate-dependent enzyme [Paenibacillus lutrae]|uniref:Aminotransferase class I/II-fold pyridoxal phosphate-dependent enzyme n=1 Tax=Paenibacillus lutrae TaxID=2078573 RepID=A0A7X3K1B9_9BACL|nr:aminotransferase class I/II-fold pyridoxal phosphate-dependent enzyme [Paenibacillus lutrae]MVP02154.1 aminotransferase class I/II-fold pyridoxal phosphate-dependent enzyme [Paenibacillus lutrae]